MHRQNLLRNIQNVPYQGLQNVSYQSHSNVPSQEIINTHDFRRLNVPFQGLLYPQVELEPLPLYLVIRRLVPPAALAPTKISNYTNSCFNFFMTEFDTNLINGSGRKNSGKDSNIKVLLRLCEISTTPIVDRYPPVIHIMINNTHCPIEYGAKSAEPAKPIDITKFCIISHLFVNNVKVGSCSGFGRAFVLSIEIVRELSEGELLSSLKSRKHFSVEDTKSLIMKKLSSDSDVDIALTSVKCSLLCPLSTTRITLPCRATTCNHLQVFDATVYIKMNAHKPTWVCPICNNVAAFKNLKLDSYFVEVLKSCKMDSTMITLNCDGSWQPFDSSQEEKLILSKQQKQKNIVVDVELDKTIDIDDSVCYENKENGTISTSEDGKLIEVITLDGAISSKFKSKIPPHKAPQVRCKLVPQTRVSPNLAATIRSVTSPIIKNDNEPTRRITRQYKRSLEEKEAQSRA